MKTGGLWRSLRALSAAVYCPGELLSMSKFVTVGFFVLVTAGCGDTSGPSPTAPTPITLQAFSMSGFPAEFAVGETAQLAARATYSDGRSEDVTARAAWSASSPACVVDATGLLLAAAEGDCSVEAGLEGANASASGRIGP